MITHDHRRSLPHGNTPVPSPWQATKRGYTWVTSGQSPEGRQFFTAITAENGIAFAERGAPCPHMGRLGHTPPSRATVLIRLSYACSAAIYDRRN